PAGAVGLHHGLIEDLEHRQWLRAPDLQIDRAPVPEGAGGSGYFAVGMTDHVNRRAVHLRIEAARYAQDAVAQDFGFEATQSLPPEQAIVRIAFFGGGVNLGIDG